MNEWTPKIPSMPGYYWVTKTGTADPNHVNLVEIDGDDIFNFGRGDADSLSSYQTYWKEALWMGPIQVPKAP